jgi:hypothetical protein
VGVTLGRLEEGFASIETSIALDVKRRVTLLGEL